MADVTYRIKLEIDKAGDLDAALPSTSKLSAIDNSFSKIGSSLSTVASSVTDLFTTAVEKAASLALTMGEVGAAAASAAVIFGLHFNNQLEQTKISFAAAFGAAGITGSMNEGLVAADQLTSKMLQDVMKLPITFKDFTDMFRSISVPGFNLGASAGELEEFSRKLVIASSVVVPNMSTKVVGREMSMMLTGHVTSANTLARNLGFVGDELEKLRHGDPADRMKMITEHLDRFAGAGEKFSTSFKAMFTTLKDIGQLFAARATSPLFDSIKGTLKDIVDWLSSHKALVGAWADAFGTRLAAAWSKGVEIAKEWGPLIIDFSEKAGRKLLEIFNELKPTIHKIADIVKGMLTDSEGTFNKIKTGLELYGIAKLGGSSLVGGAMRAGSALGPEGGLIAGAVMAGLAFDVAAASHAISHNTNVHKMWNDTTAKLSQSFEKLAEVSFPLQELFMKLVEGLGGQIVASLDLAASALKKFTDNVSFIDSIIHPGRGFDTAQAEQLNKEMIDDIHSRRNFVPGSMIPLTANIVDYMNKHPPKGELKGGGGTVVHKLEIIVNQTGDPSRVARAVVDKIADLQRYKRSSPFVSNYSSSSLPTNAR